MRNIIKEAFILVHCVSYDFILLFINNYNPYNIYAVTGNTIVVYFGFLNIHILYAGGD